jgi:hypothetical protein
MNSAPTQEFVLTVRLASTSSRSTLAAKASLASYKHSLSQTVMQFWNDPHHLMHH